MALTKKQLITIKLKAYKKSKTKLKFYSAEMLDEFETHLRKALNDLNNTNIPIETSFQTIMKVKHKYL